MGIRRIVQLGDASLRKTAKPQQKFDGRLSRLIDDLADSMYEAEGVGLAAPQVGILRRVAVVDVGEGLVELVNPELLSAQGEQCGREGCLSLKGRQAMVKRPEKVTVKAYNRRGEPLIIEGEGFLARALCHEIDHLNGQLYIDVMEYEVFDDEEPEAAGAAPDTEKG
jgi:peptide deformylase